MSKVEGLTCSPNLPQRRRASTDGDPGLVLRGISEPCWLPFGALALGPVGSGASTSPRAEELALVTSEGTRAPKGNAPPVDMVASAQNVGEWVQCSLLGSGSSVRASCGGQPMGAGAHSPLCQLRGLPPLAPRDSWWSVYTGCVQGWEKGSRDQTGWGPGGAVLRHAGTVHGDPVPVVVTSGDCGARFTEPVGVGRASLSVSWHCGQRGDVAPFHRRGEWGSEQTQAKRRPVSPHGARMSAGSFSLVCKRNTSF